MQLCRPMNMLWRDRRTSVDANTLYYFCAHIFDHVHRVLVNFVINCCTDIRKYRSLLSRNPLSPTNAGVVPLDNFCLTNINSPRSKCNAKPQSRDCGLYVLFTFARLYVSATLISGTAHVSAETACCME